MATATKPAKKAAPRATKTFSAEEADAMREAAREAKRGKNFDGTAEVLGKIAEMKELDRKLAERIRAIVAEVAPSLMPKTWYGMPAYATKEGKTICFFQAAARFKTRYATFGFSDNAKLDDGNMWPNSYALTKLTPADEKTIAALIKRAVG